MHSLRKYFQSQGGFFMSHEKGSSEVPKPPHSIKNAYNIFMQGFVVTCPFTLPTVQSSAMQGCSSELRQPRRGAEQHSSKQCVLSKSGASQCLKRSMRLHACLHTARARLLTQTNACSMLAHTSHCVQTRLHACLQDMFNNTTPTCTHSRGCCCRCSWALSGLWAKIRVRTNFKW